TPSSSRKHLRHPRAGGGPSPDEMPSSTLGELGSRVGQGQLRFRGNDEQDGIISTRSPRGHSHSPEPAAQPSPLPFPSALPKARAMAEPLTFAVPKGRILDEALPLMARAGLVPEAAFHDKT